MRTTASSFISSVCFTCMFNFLLSRIIFDFIGLRSCCDQVWHSLCAIELHRAYEASSFYRFLRCPSGFLSPSIINFAFLYKIQSRLSEKITAYRKAEGTAWLLRVGWELVRARVKKKSNLSVCEMVSTWSFLTRMRGRRTLPTLTVAQIRHFVLHFFFKNIYSKSTFHCHVGRSKTG